MQALEDQHDIREIVARYGPAADSGATDAVVSLWANDGTYEIPGIGSYTGHDELTRLFTSDLHRGYLEEGCAHVLTFPTVLVTGDTAVAKNHALLLRRRDDEFYTARVVASRWELQRRDGTWVVTSRVNELLDGRPAARDLLAHDPEDR